MSPRPTWASASRSHQLASASDAISLVELQLPSADTVARERMCYSARASPLPARRMDPTPEENDAEEDEDVGERSNEEQRVTRSEWRTEAEAPKKEEDEDDEDKDVRRKSSAGQSAASGLSGRRRAVDMSDFRSCALVQSKLKTWQGLSSTRFVVSCYLLTTATVNSPPIQFPPSNLPIQSPPSNLPHPIAPTQSPPSNLSNRLNASNCCLLSLNAVYTCTSP